MPRPTGWFDDEARYNLAKDLWAAGVGTTDIAIKLHITPSMLIGRAQRNRHDFPARRDGSAGWPHGKVNTRKRIDKPKGAPGQKRGGKWKGAKEVELVKVITAHSVEKTQLYSGAVAVEIARAISAKPVMVEIAPKKPPQLVSRIIGPARSCQYPSGESPRIRFECKQVTHMDLSYCLDHALICYEPSAHSRLRYGIVREFV